ncbi:DUF4382 domain-containing protein [Bowmanella sp. JS7-9]|uniref:DUF4382 domain-containing protein n=1 Tax=Pseudobowmanella zhangzhouensis TaxID=1537679 RepID=A0ABW1XLN1_9ALTE|nr:DUF4382 domain-containing protein [Bowmanella sp. JS7-9]TBX25953.1 hypothetical protein TK45_02580 [Bowmanella sp. JS7-9]
MNHKLITVSLIAAGVLAGCGGSNDKPLEQPNPTFALAISDAPVDDLSEVVVCFNAVELKHADGSASDSTFTVGTDPQMLTANDVCKNDAGEVIPATVGINLLDYMGMASESLLSEVSIAPGTYNQLRLVMADGSYGTVKETGEKIDVSVPSNELKLDGFTAALGNTLSFTLEFDLRKAMTNPVGQSGYFLKPRGVRLVDNNQIGHVQGTVDETILVNNSCTVAPSDITTPVATVYLYQGVSLDSNTLADNGGAEGVEPFASTTVTFDGAATYSYEIGYVPAGDYTLSLSCDTVDDPEADDDITQLQQAEVSVSANSTPVAVNFTAG